MPYKTTLEENLLLTEWRGHSTMSELIQMQVQWHANPDFDRIRFSIHDFSECDHFAYDQSGIEFSAAIDRAASYSNPQIKIALVAANNEVAKSIISYIRSGLCPFPMLSFSSMEEARTWIMKTRRLALRSD